MVINENTISGKRILLVALPGYRNGIASQMQRMGAQVDCINDKPNDGFLCKVLGRLQFKMYQRVIDYYYYQKINELKEHDYDYILVIRGEYTTIRALIKLKDTFPNARMILYMWDGLHKQNTKGIEEKWKYYDKVFTFDRIDYENNKKELNFLPLYYYEEYLPEENNKYDYDISFIGTGHADRVKIINQIMKQCSENNFKIYKYIYMPHIFVYYFNKIFNKDFKNVSLNDIHFELLPFEKLYDIYSRTRCVVDVENPGQHGLTMRSIEIVGLKRKFITTNPDIINYNFYNNNNILVIDRTNPIVDIDFLNKKYEDLPEELYEEYSLKNWILRVLS